MNLVYRFFVTSKKEQILHTWYNVYSVIKISTLNTRKVFKLYRKNFYLAYP
jgi:hypothetical protein